MNYEEKYNAALERMKSWVRGEHPECFSEAQKAAEFIFPELKESEEERIRKKVIEVLKLNIKGAESQMQASRGVDRCFEIYACNKVIAWLEKQGEQKTEPKFHPGDWITNGQLTCKVLGVVGKSYELHLYNDDYCHFETDVQSVDEDYHLWTIRDAKDGDLIYVSTEEKGIQAIFHEYKNDTIFFHCYLCADFVQGGYMPIGSVELTYPLQKTHYSRFFEKMHKAGYEWDTVKKKLRNKALDADKVIEWLNDQACQGWIEDVEVDKFADKFKKDFGI